MPMSPDVQIIGALLSACNTYGNVGFTQEILKSLQNFEFQDSGIYVLLSNLYASNKKWADVRNVRRLMKQKGISKAPGSSIIRVDGKMERRVQARGKGNWHSNKGKRVKIVQSSQVEEEEEEMVKVKERHF
ncbi:hypothetical protein LR48_Vigan06g000200 [Vigna angularis]|uniref:Pentacotripeptide-repeat region of PRORP domain-containing protein n=1 Tax=Phaseolus angularis TaxID=3914 RepID=A0A0L9UQ31_PHAAN|nr:hypothetical protein LR48_Vigan06g000200 [Vigna angularis]